MIRKNAVKPHFSLLVHSAPCPMYKSFGSQSEQVMVTQAPPPAPGVSSGSSSTSAALSGRRSPLHLPDGQLGTGMGRGQGWPLWHQAPVPWVSALLAGVHFRFGALSALLCYLCGFASVCNSNQPSAHSIAGWAYILEWAILLFRKDIKTSEDLMMPFGLRNMTTTCWKEIVFQEFNDIAEFLQIKRFWFGKERELSGIFFVHQLLVVQYWHYLPLRLKLESKWI